MRHEVINPEDELVAALCQQAGHDPDLRKGTLAHLRSRRDSLDHLIAGQVAKAIGGDDAARRRCVALFRHLPGIRADIAGKPRPRPRLAQP